MDASRFDAVTRLLARRRLIRGARSGGANDPAVARQSSSTAPGESHIEPMMLFVQAFQSGSITPSAGEPGRYTVTLDRGLGQTIYFSDRPARTVGAIPTGTFLEELGFPADNPPNAALLVDDGSGESEIAVIELFDPVFDPAGPSVTYEAAVLASWENTAELGFTQAPADLSTIAPAFGASHLFIDGLLDCPNEDMACWNIDTRETIGWIPNSDHDGFCQASYQYGKLPCLPCTPWYDDRYDALIHWSAVCNERYEACDGHCEALYVNSREAG